MNPHTTDCQTADRYIIDDPLSTNLQTSDPLITDPLQIDSWPADPDSDDSEIQDRKITVSQKTETLTTNPKIKTSAKTDYEITDRATDKLSSGTPDQFKDPLGVKSKFPDGLPEQPSAESEELDFEYYLSQISPTVTKGLEQMASQNNGRMCGKGASSLGAATAQDDCDNEERDLMVSVDNPEKHTTTMESYITFRVVTKTTRSEYEGEELQVRRRYNDFLWLRQRLEETQPTHIVPPLPEKHTLKRLDRFNQEFVLTRMVALQNFLQRIADHPVLSFNRNFHTFLTAKQWEFQAAKKEGTGLMTRWADSLHNMSAAYMMKNRAPDFVEATAYMYLFAEKIGVLDRISQRVVKEL